MIIQHLVTLKHERERREKERSVRSVGTRKRPYSRTRPRDGSRIDDVEASISILENKVQVVRKARERFPFCEGDRSTVAQFAGAQQVRGPKRAREYAGLVDAAKADAENAGMSKTDAEHDARILASATSRLISMQRWLYGFSALFFAMRWTLVEFARPVLITCDHPIVLWDAANRACAPVDLSGTGVKDLLEVRYPLNSTTCLLMTWLEGGDDSEVVRVARPSPGTSIASPGRRPKTNGSTSRTPSHRSATSDPGFCPSRPRSMANIPTGESPTVADWARNSPWRQRTNHCRTP
jgi:hypothetical protein